MWGLGIGPGIVYTSHVAIAAIVSRLLLASLLCVLSACGGGVSYTLRTSAIADGGGPPVRWGRERSFEIGAPVPPDALAPLGERGLRCRTEPWGTGASLRCELGSLCIVTSVGPSAMVGADETMHARAWLGICDGSRIVLSTDRRDAWHLTLRARSGRRALPLDGSSVALAEGVACTVDVDEVVELIEHAEWPSSRSGTTRILRCTAGDMSFEAAAVMSRFENAHPRVQDGATLSFRRDGGPQQLLLHLGTARTSR